MYKPYLVSRGCYSMGKSVRELANLWYSVDRNTEEASNSLNDFKAPVELPSERLRFAVDALKWFLAKPNARHKKNSAHSHDSVNGVFYASLAGAASLKLTGIHPKGINTSEQLARRVKNTIASVTQMRYYENSIIELEQGNVARACDYLRFSQGDFETVKGDFSLDRKMPIFGEDGYFEGLEVLINDLKSACM